MTEPTRRLPDPTIAPDGKLVGKSALTPQAMNTRGAIAVPSSKVIPVVMVPGTMGSNLRANTAKGAVQHVVLEPGEPAWRPPNGKLAGLNEASAWSARDPALRQKILDGDMIEVDDTGLIELPNFWEGLAEDQLRARGWGEVHWDSYGGLLCELQHRLNTTFENPFIGRKQQPNSHWESVMNYDREKWNAPNLQPLTAAELEKFSKYQYPLYACGYNWTQSNELSGERLQKRILDIIDFWTKRKFDCRQVILVTHSMGGLVGRSCAKQIPDKIAGVVHGVMPALGAPLAYRRMACGTENSSPSAGPLDNFEMSKFAEIAGDTTAKTTPVMATACGALELLPNHLYPSPWLMASVKKADGKIEDLCHLQHNNIYDLYRDFNAWFRAIDPALADPADKFDNAKETRVLDAIRKAIDQAEKFHTKVLDTYYHPNTYAYYGADEKHLSFGVFRWLTNDANAAKDEFRQLLPAGKTIGSATFDGGRPVVLPKNSTAAGKGFDFHPAHQDAPGDGTVPAQSGDGPRAKVKAIFRTTGYDHQGSYKDKHMLKLTFHLIARIAQEAK